MWYVRMIQCIICNKEIAKYKLDIGDRVQLDQGCVCDDCSYIIAVKRLQR